MSNVLSVVVDLGSSQTRVLWSVDGGKISAHWFTSDCSLPTSAQETEEMGRNSYFVAYGKRSYVIGVDASASPLSENARENVKAESAIPKVMAALHVAIAATELVSPSIELVVLLPYSEFRSFKVLEKALAKNLRQFSCNRVGYGLQIDHLECLAEGCGILRYFTNLYPSLESQSILTVMVGYRDLTLISSTGSNGSVVGRTARLGLMWMLKDMEKQLGDIDRFKAAELLYRLGDGNIRASDCTSLASTISQELRSEELKLIARAARASRKKYKDFIGSVFKELKIDEIDAVLLGGGTGDYLFSFLNETMSEKLMTTTPLANQLIKLLGCEESQAIRMADVYAVAVRQAKQKQLVMSS